MRISYSPIGGAPILQRDVVTAEKTQHRCASPTVRRGRSPTDRKIGYFVLEEVREEIILTGVYGVAGTLWSVVSWVRAGGGGRHCWSLVRTRRRFERARRS